MAEFVLVHGSTQSPAGWDRLTGALGTHGHRVTTIDLPVDQPGWTVADYAREAATQAGEQAGRRVVAGHSGAGVLLPAIAQAAGASAVAWLAAYVPDLTRATATLDHPGLHPAHRRPDPAARMDAPGRAPAPGRPACRGRRGPLPTRLPARDNRPYPVPHLNSPENAGRYSVQPC